jgi:branched-chain amino acid transport system ATP-binding protein
VIQLSGVSVYYGEVRALSEVSLVAQDGQVTAILGANGAGKTTLLSTAAGFVRPASGKVLFRGEDIGGLAPHLRSRLGIVQVFEGRRLFPEMTVQENLEMGAYLAPASELPGLMEEIFQLFPRLAERRRQLAKTLSGGEAQMLAIGRAFMARPKALLLDEPSMGLAPVVVRQVMERIAAINRLGITVLLVEQNANVALGVCQRAYVLRNGRVVMSGSAEEVRGDPELLRAYLA